MVEEHATDSPIGWVNRHIQQYVETDGAKGHHYQGYDSLLLTTRGRRSGDLRRTALFYGKDGDRYLLVASNGGSPTHPAWYLNLAAHPEVELQVGADRFAAMASTASGDERARLFELMASIFLPYNEYQAKAGREIPVVVLERLSPVTS
jgi:deazaflavin-dependent oxidoreductase (nitroreductase family)